MSVKNSNILVAFANLVAKTELIITEHSTSTNRANQMGESLETYVKDLFCDSYELNSADKLIEYNNHFSYLGNQNNPPDIMLRGGDAIEVKKIESKNSQLALNSSHPKDKLHADDPKINIECKSAEVWTEKDIIYTVGYIHNSSLRSLWFVYGNCYAARRETYTRLSKAISEGINSLDGIEFGITNELARVNKVDPLGITYLRVRGMWGINNPIKVYDYIPEAQGKFANLLVLKEKYDAFPEIDRLRLEALLDENFTLKSVMMKDPNNPANLLEAVLLSYSKSSQD